MGKHELHLCPRCGAPMVASYAIGCFGGGESVEIPIGYACARIDCQSAARREWEERENQAIARAVEKGVIDK